MPIRLLFFLLLLYPAGLFAQAGYELGLSGDMAIKAPLMPDNKPAGSPLFAACVSACISVKGNTPGALGFTGTLGVLTDRSRYKVAGGSWFATSPAYLQVSGLIAFPLKNEHLEFLGGIDLQYYLGTGMEISTSNNVTGPAAHSFDMDLDSNYGIVNRGSRKLIPGISAGIRYTYSELSRWHIYVLVSQPLLSRLEEEVALSCRVDGMDRIIMHNAQPTYCRLGFMWRLYH
jgi:hypothetical protein